MQPQLVYVTHAPHDPLGVPFVAPLRHPMVFPAPDPQLHTKIINQIDYYFRCSFSYFLVIIRSLVIVFPVSPLKLKLLFPFMLVYCSNDNLIKDTFLRRNMDDQGWVRIKLIAGFNKVSLLGKFSYVYIYSLLCFSFVAVHGVV